MIKYLIFLLFPFILFAQFSYKLQWQDTQNTDAVDSLQFMWNNDISDSLFKNPYYINCKSNAKLRIKYSSLKKYEL